MGRFVPLDVMKPSGHKALGKHPVCTTQTSRVASCLGKWDSRQGESHPVGGAWASVSQRCPDTVRVCKDGYPGKRLGQKEA